MQMDCECDSPLFRGCVNCIVGLSTVARAASQIKDVIRPTVRRYASAVYAMAVSVSVSARQSRNSTKTAQWIELIFGMEASFHPSYTVL